MKPEQRKRVLWPLTSAVSGFFLRWISFCGVLRLFFPPTHRAHPKLLLWPPTTLWKTHLHPGSGCECRIIMKSPAVWFLIGFSLSKCFIISVLWNVSFCHWKLSLVRTNVQKKMPHFSPGFSSSGLAGMNITAETQKTSTFLLLTPPLGSTQLLKDFCSWPGVFQFLFAGFLPVFPFKRLLILEPSYMHFSFEV